MKIPKETIEEMKRLRSEGKRYSEISKILNVRADSVSYHTNEKIRNKVKETVKRCQKNRYEEKRSWYHNNREKALKIMKECNHRRYHTDEEFRKKHIKYVKEREKRLLATDPNYREKKKEANRRWYQRNKEKIALKNKERRMRMRQCDATERQ